jgi:hypothetical protein
MPNKANIALLKTADRMPKKSRRSSRGSAFFRWRRDRRRRIRISRNTSRVSS